MKTGFVMAVVFVVLVWGSAQGRTWRIEKDGSGDFENIQPAMEVCSSGDTILIGPGRFDQFSEVAVGSGYTMEAVAGVTQDNLTFIGAGLSNTIIGPTEYYDSGSHPHPKLFASIGAEDITFKGMALENTDCLVYWYNEGSISITGCSFSEFRLGIMAWPFTELDIQNSEFSTSRSWSYHINSSGTESLLVENCCFYGSGSSGTGIYLSTAQSAEIHSCYFDVRYAIHVSGVSQLLVSNTSMGENVRGGMNVSGSGAEVELFSNELFGNHSALYVAGGTVFGTGNIFSGGGELSTIFVSYGATVTLNNNHIFHDGQYAAKADSYLFELITNDFTGNYWGSTDPEEIAEWIWDYEDDPDTGAYIDFLPIAEEVVSTQEKSFDSFKALFR